VIEHEHHGDRICPQCGEPMDVNDTLWFVQSRGHFYCSEKCARIAVGQRV
jgi:endogenous inhibitor of DNA gyrase (YacG/DUF329 family)